MLLTLTFFSYVSGQNIQSQYWTDKTVCLSKVELYLTSLLPWVDFVRGGFTMEIFVTNVATLASF